jgi:branched-chain amino acid transport system substrate-binding protein
MKVVNKVVALLVASLALNACATPAPSGPVKIGVSGPLTGPAAQYGTQWKRGFDLALEEINKTGVNGRKIEYVFEDTQADPKQSVVVAQKFVNDPSLVMEMGDFASGASMAASPIYQQAGMLQFGFTNSHPDFTKGGDYMWSNSVTQDDASPVLAEYTAQNLKVKNVAVAYVNNDWGVSSHAIFAKKAAALGLNVVAAEKYQADEKDFAPTLTRINEAKPEALVMFSLLADGSQLVLAADKLGLKLPLVAGSSLHDQNFIKVAGKAAEGFHLKGQFTLDDPRNEVQAFIKAYRAKYNEDPNFFAAHSYDAMKVAAEAIRLASDGGKAPTRAAIKDAFAKLEVPSIIYGKIKFNTESRRVSNPQFVGLRVVDGKFVAK